jgi:tagatose-1,6-bisphosphate aldolase
MFYLKPVRNPREKLDRWKWVVTEKEFDLGTQKKFPVLVRPDQLRFDGRIPSSVLFRILVTLARRKGEAVREEVQALINQCTERCRNQKIPLSARTLTYEQFITETFDKNE